MRCLVTGADGSLGSELLKKTGTIGLPKFLNNKKAIEHLIDNYLQGFGSITHVINNDGLNHLSWIGETPGCDSEIFNVNVLAPYWVINALVARKQVCRVINVASATYRIPQRCTTLYCASKAALIQMTKVMARELAPKGWVINAIAPGMIEDTQMSELTNSQVENLRGWSKSEAREYALKLLPMNRFTTKAEVAEAIWKIFDLPDYINGTVIDMMGGV